MIRVLIVDDSPVIRKLFIKSLDRKHGIEVVGEAADPYEARDLIVELKPDVITLDVEMPKMDGITFLKKIMTYFPVPTIIVSSVTKEGSQRAIEALDAGAIAVVGKATPHSAGEHVIEELVKYIQIASKIDIKDFKKKLEIKRKPNLEVLKFNGPKNKILAIGSSTGGVEALRTVLPLFPKDAPPIVVVQHMPPVFTNSLAHSLGQICECSVKEAAEGDVLAPGHIFIAPGDFHMMVQKTNAHYSITLKQGPPVCFQRPAADVLFQSVARAAGKDAVGIILTGMGSDGTVGAKSMKQAGAKIIAQDETTSVVYGMPKSVVDAGAADFVLPLSDIPAKALDLIKALKV